MFKLFFCKLRHVEGENADFYLGIPAKPKQTACVEQREIWLNKERESKRILMISKTSPNKEAKSTLS